MAEQIGEAQRLQALAQYGILDTAPEETFDRISRIVSTALRVPIAAVTLVDEKRQWFKSRIGMTTTETPRSASFCAHTMLEDRGMVISDALLDQRFVTNPLVAGDPHIRFYAGYPIISTAGVPLGAVCAIDTTPRAARPDELVLLKDLAALVVEQLELRLVAFLDGLTGALRRQPFLNMAAREILLSRRSKLPGSCLMIDADHFKAINDGHSHDVGDQVLKTLVHTLKSSLRSTDLVGRLGGEEFGVFMPLTDGIAAADVAERIRDRIEKLDIAVAGVRVPVTISIGVAELSSQSEDIMSLLHRADCALMTAKQTGRNRVVAARADFLAVG